MTTPATAITTGELIRLLAGRGPGGVTVAEVAARDPRRHHHHYDYSVFDDEPADQVLDLGERGPQDPEILASARHRLASLVRSGAVLTVPGWTPGRSVDLSGASQVVLEGWSGLDPVSRSRPLHDELGLPPVQAVAAFLRAAGTAGAPRGAVAWWSPRPGTVPAGQDPYMFVTWHAAVTALRGQGWDIRSYHGVVPGDLWWQAVSAPGQPARPPADVPPAPRRDDPGWPEHGYLYDPDLWDAILAAEDGSRGGTSWTGGYGRSNPMRSSASPRWLGQPVPGGEQARRQLLGWARDHGHDQVTALAVPGSVTLVTGAVSDPVGLEEIARRLGVTRSTADKWRQRRLLPEPAWTVGGRPAWPWEAVREWAERTGRIKTS